MIRWILTLFCALGIAAGGLFVAQARAVEPQPTPVLTEGSSVQPEHNAPVHLSPKAVKPKNTVQKRRSVHAAGWVFQEGKGSKEEWHDAVPTETLQKRAVGEQAAKNQSVNTESGINSALNEAEGSRRKGGMGVSVGQESSSWREAVGPESPAPDEDLPMESRRVVRAYADVPASDDLSISVGPELILKNEQRERASDSQPDSSLGMGMRFKFDF